MYLKSYITTFLNLCLLLTMALVIVVIIKSPQFIRASKQSDYLIVEMNDQSNDENKANIKAFLSKSPYIDPESIKYYSRTDALGILDLEDTPLAENPFRDIFAAQFLQGASEQFLVVEKQLRAQEGVIEVLLEKTVSEGAQKNIRRIGWVLFIISVFLMITILTIKYVLLKIWVKSSAKEHQVLHLAGAANDYIMKPVLKENLKESLIVSLGAIILSFLVIRWFNNMFEGSLEISATESVVIIAIVTIIGVVLPFMFVYYSLNKILQNQ